METNSEWHMKKVLDHLKRVNPSACKLPRIVMVDKALHEVQVIRQELPETRVLLCVFHVVKYMATQIASSDYTEEGVGSLAATD